MTLQPSERDRIGYGMPLYHIPQNRHIHITLHEQAMIPQLQTLSLGKTTHIQVSHKCVFRP